MALTPQQVGTKKLGTYELVKEVSASSVGATFVAKAQGGDRSVLLTKIHRHVAKSPQLIDALLHEAKKATSLVHPHIASIADSGVSEGEPFIAYEYGDGETLATLIRRAGPEGLPLGVAARIVADVLDAIGAAHIAGPPTDSTHSSGLGHGELGPWCIHVGANGRTRVTGFAVDRAIARFGLHFAKNLDRLPYAAPERVKPMSLTLGPPPPPPDLACDLFSAAIIAWELFTRQRLFASRMEAAVIQKVLASAIPDPKQHRSELSDDVSKALLGALAREVGARIKLSALLEAVEAGEISDYDVVADFMSRQVDKSQARSLPPGARPAFASVRPPASGQSAADKTEPEPVKAPSLANGAKANGAKTMMQGTPTAQAIATAAAASDAAPARAPAPARNKTLIGGVSVEKIAAEKAAAEKAAAEKTAAEKASAEKAAAEKAAAEKAAPEKAPEVALPPVGRPPMPSSEALGDDDLVEEVTVEAAPAAVAAAIASASQSPSPPQVAAKPPPRRQPPKPRQQTLIGVEPLENALQTPAAEAKAAEPPKPAEPPKATESPKPAATAKAPEPAPEPASAEHGRPDVPRAFGAGNRVRTGLTIGKPPQAYQILAPVARGGMAEVWAARHAESAGIEKLVAIKTMLPELSDDPDFEVMFMDEMRVASRIRHSNVAEILSVGEEDGVMYIVMEWVEGETLANLQQASKPIGGFPIPVLVRLARDICAGLHAAHEVKDDQGHLVDLVHRDINPSNVVVTRDGSAKVVDFGIAKSKGRMHVTRAGSMVKGKTPYLSPEQLGGLAIDRRSDLFSLGALLYVTATGVHPFRGESELKTIENIVLKKAEPLRSVVPDINPDFEKLVLRLLEKDPKKRPATATEVAAELERIETQLAQPATEVTVATFVESAVGDVLRKRRNELVDALATFDPAAAAAARAELTGPFSGKVAAPNAAVAALDLAGTSPAPAAAAEPIAKDPTPAPPAPLPSAAIDDAPTAIDEAAPIAAAAMFAPQTIDAPSPEVPAFDGENAAAPTTAPEAEDAEFAPARPRPPWVRLVVLVALGIVVGIALIALIESLRKSKETTANSGKPTSSALATNATTKPPVTATSTATTPAATTPSTPQPSAVSTDTVAPSSSATDTTTTSSTATQTATTRPTSTYRPPTSRPSSKPPKVMPTTI
ncbi:MAG: serine/threonine-protein kinase [Polyangiaceae bacterium]